MWLSILFYTISPHVIISHRNNIIIIIFIFIKVIICIIIFIFIFIKFIIIIIIIFIFIKVIIIIIIIIFTFIKVIIFIIIFFIFIKVIIIIIIIINVNRSWLRFLLFVDDGYVFYFLSNLFLLILIVYNWLLSSQRRGTSTARYLEDISWRKLLNWLG